MLTRRDADYYRAEFARLLEEKRRVDQVMQARLQSVYGADEEWERLSDVFMELERKKTSVRNHLGENGYDLRHRDYDKYLAG